MEKPNTPLAAPERWLTDPRLGVERTPSHGRCLVSELRPILDLLARDHALVALCDERDEVTWLQDRLGVLSDAAEAYIGHPIQEVIPEYVEGGRFHDAIEIETTDGERAYLDIRSFPVSAAHHAQAIVARRVSDIRREAHEEGGSAALLAAVLDAAPDPALVCDQSGFITFANPAASAFLGTDPAQLVGRPLVSCVPSRPGLTNLLDGMLSHEVVGLETQVPGGEDDSWMSISSKRLRSLTGEVQGHVVFIRDTSEQHQARHDLAARSDEFDDYVSHISHDLRSPLVSVLGFAGLLKRDYSDFLKGNGLRFLERIEQAGHTMQSMIESLLEFSRVGESEDEATPTEPGSVLQQVLTDQKKHADGQDVTIHLPEDPPLLDCNRTHAYQIFSNLVSNALAHMGPAESPSIWIDIEERPHQHHIRVRDNGTGVPKSEQERIFELFTTLPRAQQEPPVQSTGVGLAIVRKLATQYGGKAWVETPASGGAEFNVTLTRR
jgi:PAS domain S-box-containing protein